MDHRGKLGHKNASRNLAFFHKFVHKMYLYQSMAYLQSSCHSGMAYCLTVNYMADKLLYDIS